MELRKIIAFIIAPLLPALYFIAFIIFAESYSGIYIIVFVAVIVSYLSSILVGLPTLFILRSLGWLCIPMLILFGTLAGVIVFYLFIISFGYSLGSSASFGFYQAIFGAVCGLSVSLCFGLIAGLNWRMNSLNN